MKTLAAVSAAYLAVVFWSFVYVYPDGEVFPMVGSLVGIILIVLWVRAIGRISTTRWPPP